MSNEEEWEFSERTILFILVGVIIGTAIAALGAGDFGVEGEPGVDDTHLDRPRYVRLADNGSMLVSDDHRILEVDVAGQIVWQIRGTFCDIAWLDNETWAALNGTSTNACDQVLFSNGTMAPLPHPAQRLHPAGDDLVVGSMHQNITKVSLAGDQLETCPFVTGYISDLDLDHYLYDGDLYSYNLSSCSSSAAGTPPGDNAYSFHPMANGTFAYGVGWNNGSRAVVWGSWTSWVTSFPDDLAWNGTHLAVADINAHVVRVWDLDDPPPPADGDHDGVPDAQDPCPTTWGNATDVPGCPDLDGDGVTDSNDPCPTDPVDGCVDLDGDGYNATVDACPATWGNSTIDRLGCPDTDGDGTSDLNDPCPDDPLDRCNDPTTWPPTVWEVHREVTNRTATFLFGTNESCDGDAQSFGVTYGWSQNGTAHNFTFRGNEIQPNTTHTKMIWFTNTVNGTTWLNVTFTTLPDLPENTTVDNLSWDPYVEWVHTETGNDSMWFNYWANETVTPVLDVQLDHSWYDLEGQQFQLSLSGLTPNTTYSISSTFYNEHNGSVTLWENFTTREAVYPWPPDGDGNNDGDGDGLLDATYILISIVLLAGLSAAIFVGARPEREIRPPRVPAPLPEVPWTETDLDELEDPLEEVADPTIPLASPDLFAQLPELPAPGKMFLPEAPSPVPRDMPYLAIQVAEAEDLPVILESLKCRVKPEISEENHKVMKDVLDMEKRLRQLRDGGDIARRKYEQLLREVEELKRAIQNLTPVMERRDWDV